MKKKTQNKTWQDIEQDINSVNSTKKRKSAIEEEKEFNLLKAQFIAHLDKLAESCDKGRIWADSVDDKVFDFYSERGIYPNILLANDKTYDKIAEFEKDKPENRVWEGDGEPPDDFTGFSSFVAESYTLELCIDNRLKVDTFKLVYDEGPIFDGKEEPEEIVKAVYNKKAA